jgi:hypothetical protein
MFFCMGLYKSEYQLFRDKVKELRSKKVILGLINSREQWTLLGTQQMLEINLCFNIG